MLREAFASTDEEPLLFLEDLDGMDLTKTFVRREHRHVDILLTNEDHKLAVIVENKIWTSEHSDQLERYHRIVQGNHPDWRVFGIYLTPYGDAPSHEAYAPLGYGTVCGALDKVLEDRGSTISPDVRISIEHYVRMVRRHIVGDSDVARICQQIYRKHRRALDLIYEHRSDVQAEIRDAVEGLIERESRFELDYGNKSKIKFGVLSWDTPALLTSEGWTRSKRILLFEIWNYPGSLDLKLFVGPGLNSTRQRLFEMVRASLASFGGRHRLRAVLKVQNAPSCASAPSWPTARERCAWSGRAASG